jgi:hypothetical protein
MIWILWYLVNDLDSAKHAYLDDTGVAVLANNEWSRV